ncbi:MAG: glycerol-3-phosphate acyltransferase [Anaerolineae bacterium]|uniref:glycerol-3-phosphate acyltransferase n=1 Tax=Promineifilum sp. TaxID=2664178 RepID=UPI001D3A7685|nr:glycerol-3-phosphate acyltransferase [Anaerolineales bacterium]MCB8935577.1 glycerol-3-phosphate acyltransferase [Promineifilum sp.]MCO5180626.1 glycerol-3-phosphate acyltransferase [Promineifilum sp.]MCW5847647.1 glycerol-3-phosphate acyltransferase [Anaerolineae bacterium]
MQILYFILAGLVGYLCGSIPFGYLYVRLFKGEDLRTIGSGRTGGTNSLRAAGLGVGVLTSFSDVLKGAAAVWLTTWLFGDALGPALLPWAQATAGVLSVVGHNWSIFLKFGGGAGTGPNVGWSSAIWLWIVPIAFLVMSGMLYFVGMASVASLSMAAVTIIIFAYRYFAGIDVTLAYLAGSIVAGLVVTWALRPNIKRVMNGTERLVGRRAKRRAQQEAKQ